MDFKSSLYFLFSKKTNLLKCVNYTRVFKRFIQFNKTNYYFENKFCPSIKLNSVMNNRWGFLARIKKD